MCPSLLFVISIRLDPFDIAFLGGNASAFGLDSSGGALLCDVVGTFVTIGFFGIVVGLFFVVFVAIKLFGVILVVVIAFSIRL